MNLLFLDVDGVLNMYGSSFRSFKTIDPLEDIMVKRLEYILENVNDLQIVVSSSWLQDRLIERLIKHQFKYINRIIGRTPRAYQGDFNEKTRTYELFRSNRGEQIHAYLEAVKDQFIVDKYLVIDDDYYDIVERSNPAISKNNFLQINGYEGLSNLDSEIIIDYFNTDSYVAWKFINSVNSICNTTHKVSEFYSWYDLDENDPLYKKYKWLDKGKNLQRTLSNWDMSKDKIIEAFL